MGYVRVVLTNGDRHHLEASHRHVDEHGALAPTGVPGEAFQQVNHLSRWCLVVRRGRRRRSDRGAALGCETEPTCPVRRDYRRPPKRDYTRRSVASWLRGSGGVSRTILGRARLREAVAAKQSEVAGLRSS
jgi:hypothetical protein